MRSKSDHRSFRFQRPGIAAFFLAALMASILTVPSNLAWAGGAAVCGNGVVEPGEGCDPGGRCAPSDGSSCTLDSECPAGSECVAIGADGDCCSANCQIEESLACATCDDGLDSDQDGLADRFDPECASLAALYGHALVATDSLIDSRGARFNRSSSVRSVDGTLSPFLSGFPPYPPYPPYPLGPSSAATCLPHVAFEGGVSFDGPVSVRGNFSFARTPAREIGPTMFAGIPADADPRLFPGSPGFAYPMTPARDASRGNSDAMVGIGSCSTAGAPCVTRFDCPGATETCTGKVALRSEVADNLGLVDRIGASEAYADCLAALEELAALPELLRQQPRTLELPGLSVASRKDDLVIQLADGEDAVISLDSVKLRPSGKLILSGNARSVVIFVSDRLVFSRRSNMELAGGLTADRVLWILDGRSLLRIGSSDENNSTPISAFGTFWATTPRFSTTVGSASRLSGALFSDGVRLQENSSLEHVPFSPLLPVDLTVQLEAVPNPPNPELDPDSGIVASGENLLYTVRVSSHGPSLAPAVTVVKTLPDEVAFLAATASQGRCIHDGSVSGGTVSCYLGTLGREDQTPANEATVWIDAQVLDNVEGDLEGNVEVSAGVGELFSDDNEATVVTPAVTLCNILTVPPAPPTFALVTDSGVPGDRRTNVPDVLVQFAACGTWEYQVDGGAFNPGIGETFQLSIGTHSYAARHTDLEGTTSPASEPQVFEYDAESAAISLVLMDSNDQPVPVDPENPSASSATNDPGAYLAIDGIEAGATWSYIVDLEGDWIEGSGATLALEEGLHQYVVRQIDLAGNQSGTGGEFYLDSTGIGPLTVELAEDTGTPGDGVTFNPEVLVDGIKLGAIWEVRIDDRPVWTRGSGVSFELLAGTHIYTARQSDEAGSVFTSEPVEFTYVGEAATPLLRLEVDSGPGEDGILVDGISNQPRVLIYNLEPGATWEYRVGDGPWTSGTGDGFDMLEDGEAHSYFARQTNSAGKPSLESAEAMFQFDDTPPAPLAIALVTDSGTAGDGITNVPSIQVSVLEERDLFEYRLDDGVWTLWRSDIVPMEVGAHSYQVRRYDVAGNASTVTEGTFTYLNADVDAPKAALVDDSGNNPADGITNDGRIHVVISGADPDATWEYQIDDGPWLPGSGDSFAAEPGSHTYRVRQRDAAGNESAASDPVTFHLSQGVPVFSSATFANVADPDSEGQLLIGTDVVLYTAVASDPDGSGVSYSLADDTDFGIDALTGELRFKEPIGYSLAGPNLYVASIVATNAAGNTAARNVDVHVGRTNTSAPQIDLGEVKTGVLTFDQSYSPLSLYPPGGYLGVRSNTVYRLDERGLEDADFQPIPVPASQFLRVLADAQGRIYVFRNLPTFQGLSLTRYNADGTLDSGYGSGGTIPFTPSPSSDLYMPSSAGIRSDGTFFAVGTQRNASLTSLYSTLWIVAPSGTVLTHQAEDVSPVGNEDHVAVMAGASAQDLYVVNGIIPSGGNVFYRLFRYSNGNRDMGFGSGGMVDFGTTTPWGAWVDPQGRLLTLLPSGVLRRYSAAGVVDGGFTAPTLTVQQSVLVTFRPDGGIFYYASSSVGATVRALHSNGTLDTSFGTAGVLDLGARSVTNASAGFVRTRRDFFAHDAAGTSLELATTSTDYTEGTNLARITRFSTTGELPTDFGDVALTITEGNRPIAMLTTAASVIDLDNAGSNYAGVSVTIERQGGANAADVFDGRGFLQLNDQGEVVWDAAVVGAYTQADGRLEIVFHAAATHPVFDGALRALTYYNGSQQPDARVRLVWTVNDNDPAGARSTSAVQTINIANDRADVGDSRLVTSLNGQATTFQNYARIDGKHYYVLPGQDHYQLDQQFHGGADTTDGARSVTPADGHTYKLLTRTELEALWASPDLPASHSAASLGNVWTATLGNGPDEHLAYYYGSFSSVTDYDEYAVAIVEVVPSPFAATGPVEPRFALAEDNGDLSDDNLTSNGRINILGFERALAHEYSIDGGANWTSRPAGSDLFFVLPVGIHPVAMVKARQSDQSGFETEIVSTVGYNIDPTIRSMQLLNDQGLNTGDNITADGRVVINNFDPLLPWEYSRDGGQNWQSGGPLAGGLGFTLPNGIYPAGEVRVRQDVSGFLTGTKNNTTYVVDQVGGQGRVDLATDTGASASDGLTADPRIFVTGLRDTLAWDYSTDGGSNWLPGNLRTGAVQLFSLAEGNYGSGALRVRQGDATGFETSLAGTAAFVVDVSIGDATITLVNDTGISNTDLTSADGTVHFALADVEAGDTWEYTIDGGSNWVPGSGNSGADIVLANGSYTPRQVMVRLNDRAGNQFVAAFVNAFRIDDTDVTAPTFTSAARVAILDPDAQGPTTIAPSRTLYTPIVSDVNLVVFSLSGPGAGDFQIDAVTGKLTFAVATGFQTGGPNSRVVTIVATDLFGNPASFDVTIELLGPPKLVSTMPADDGSMPAAGSLTFTFDVPVKLGTGNINIFNLTTFDGFVFPVGDASQVSVAGNTVTLRPTTPLADNSRVVVFVDRGAVLSLDGFPWEGISSFGALNFTVSSSVQVHPTEVQGLDGEVSISLAPEDESQSDYASSIFAAGDVNGDGKRDLLVAIPKSDPGGRTDAGRVYVVFGTDAMTSIDLAQVAAGTGGFVINGVSGGDRMGDAAAGVGDFNGDGKADIAVTAPSAGGNVGKAWVVYGKSNGNPVELSNVNAGIGGFSVEGEDTVRNFNRVTGIGDFNDDGIADMAFGSTGAKATVIEVTSRDEVKEWTETRTWDTVDVEVIRTREPVTVVNPFAVYNLISDPLEFAVDNVSELLTDPKSTLVNDDTVYQEKTETRTTTTTWTQTIRYRQVTTYTNTTTWTYPSAGIVYVLFGGHPAGDYQNLTLAKISKASSTIGFSITGIEAGGELGSTMAAVDDVNDDGFADFYVAQRPWVGDVNKGFVLLGNGAANRTNFTSSGLAASGAGYEVVDTAQVGAGSTAAGLGDVNADGFSDFAIGSRGGRVYVVHGRAGSGAVDLAGIDAGSGGYVIHPDGRDEPTVLSALGDVNGDSIPDLLASDMYRKAWVIYGRAGTTPVELTDVADGVGGFRLEANGGYIDGITGTGDFNGDGLGDFVLLMSNSSGSPYLKLLPGSVAGPSW